MGSGAATIAVGKFFGDSLIELQLYLPGISIGTFAGGLARRSDSSFGVLVPLHRHTHVHRLYTGYGFLPPGFRLSLTTFLLLLNTRGNPTLVIVPSRVGWLLIDTLADEVARMPRGIWRVYVE